jgi:ABC-type multidrug transport system fused ATPase/permease subunit
MAEQLPASTTLSTPTPDPAQVRRKRIIQTALIAAAVLIVALIVGGVILAYQNPEGARVTRDIAIIFLAVLSIGISIMVILLLYQVSMLTLLMRDEIKPLLESINETMNTVRGTAAFMSDNIAQPTIEIASAFAGVRRVFEALAGIRSSVNPTQRKE